MEIRLFQEKDTEQIARLFYETVREVNICDYSANQVKAWAPDNIYFRDWAKVCSKRLTYVADDEGTIVGFAELELKGHIGCFYCHKNHQRMGLGSKIYTEIESNARELGIKHLYTEASITAKPFFLKMGFSVIKEQTVECRGETFINYVMEKYINNNTITRPDPIRLEIFKNLYQFIAEQMGIILQNTSVSVNIKERLDFSCAIFDQDGLLVANAPHIPVHLGSMSESVRSLIKDKSKTLEPENIYLSNNPYNGGTHLPDVTIITPVFEPERKKIIFYVASRGHQADIGGITPGSMPPYSKTVEEEGILFDNFILVQKGIFREDELRELLLNNPYPARNIEQNIADFQAQIAANERGAQELLKMVTQYGIETVQTYMKFVQNNAEEAVRRAIDVLKDGAFIYEMDNGAKIQVKVTIHSENRSATIDFTGTSEQLQSNFNAPKAVTQAAVLYVFRTLVNDKIPLNAGCLKPLEIIIPESCMLNPVYPAAVVAGNVETSQTIVDALYGALGIMAASQSTMNNFTFGNDRYQYYETICGGSGAGKGFNGTDAVQVHMTNSRLTDPEVLESRYPVLLESFNIRPDSGGKGQYSGGNGVIRRIKFLEPMTANILSNRRIIPPFGLNGGESGQVGRTWIQRQDGTIEVLESTATVEMDKGEIFVIETPGGGGFGENCYT